MPVGYATKAPTVAPRAPAPSPLEDSTAQVQLMILTPRPIFDLKKIVKNE
jgi:hypothetical protein